MIFYFSGTGNSQWAAKTLALQTQDELYSIAEIIKTDCTFQLKKGRRCLSVMICLQRRDPVYP